MLTLAALGILIGVQVVANVVRVYFERRLATAQRELAASNDRLGASFRQSTAEHKAMLAKYEKLTTPEGEPETRLPQ